MFLWITLSLVSLRKYHERQTRSSRQNLHVTNIVVTFVLYIHALRHLPTEIFCSSNANVNVRGYAILTAPKTSVSLPYKLVRAHNGKRRKRDRYHSFRVCLGAAMSRGEAVGLFGFCTGSAQRS